MTATAALLFAYLLDLLIGDPRWLPHPVRGIGKGIEKMESWLRRSISCFKQDSDIKAEDQSMDSDNEDVEEKMKIDLADMVPSFLCKGEDLSVGVQEKIAGGLLTAVVVGAVYVLFALLSNILLSLSFHPIAAYIAFAVYVYLIACTLATRGLLSASQAVISEIRKGDLENSRRKLAMIVGRDTHGLKKVGVMKATIETLAENASDGIVAPLFYFVIGGLPLAMAYKAINTLDSMVGYKNDKYKNLGWASAKLDDIANYIPARITAMLIVAAVYIVNCIRYVICRSSQWLNSMDNKTLRYIGKLLNKIESRIEAPDFESGENAFTIMRRDGSKHSSPNCGFPEAAMAGALGVRLGGPSVYGGKTVKKPYIGNAVKIEPGHGKDQFYMKASLAALALTRLTSFLGLLLAGFFV